jgi:hypothetical protein
MAGYDDYDYDAHARTSRRVVVGIAALVAGLCVAFLIGYASHGGSRGAADSRIAPDRPAPAPTPASTGATHAPPQPAAPQPVSGRQLHRNSVGVIVGYRHDSAGAVAAAGNYTASLYVQTNRTHARELAVLTSIAATSADAARMAGDFSSEDAALAKILGVADLQSAGVIAYGHPQGYRVDSATSSAATIDVYVAGGQGMADAPSDSGAAGETFYEVDQVQLVWDRDDWRITNWSHLVQDNGPELATVAAQGYLPFPISGEVGP